MNMPIAAYVDLILTGSVDVPVLVHTWALVVPQADALIQDALQHLRSKLPPRLRDASRADIEAALVQLKSYYRGPYQVAKLLQDSHKSNS